jgi:hypothetical protein
MLRTGRAGHEHVLAAADVGAHKHGLCRAVRAWDRPELDIRPCARVIDGEDLGRAHLQSYGALPVATNRLAPCNGSSGAVLCRPDNIVMLRCTMCAFQLYGAGCHQRNHARVATPNAP